LYERKFSKKTASLRTIWRHREKSIFYHFWHQLYFTAKIIKSGRRCILRSKENNLKPPCGWRKNIRHLLIQKMLTNRCLWINYLFFCEFWCKPKPQKITFKIQKITFKSLSQCFLGGPILYKIWPKKWVSSTASFYHFKA